MENVCKLHDELGYRDLNLSLKKNKYDLQPNIKILLLILL